MPGRHLLQIPGPSNVPGRVLEAIARPTIDHRGAAFAALASNVQQDLKRIFGTANEVVMFPGSGTGAWEAALVNTLSPGDRVLFYETGHFASVWSRMANRLGFDAVVTGGDWRRGVVADEISKHLSQDRDHAIKAVCVVHNETSTGALSNIVSVRNTLDELGHPALLLVDTISSLGSVLYKHDEWGVDVTVGASQKGLMLPPGLSFNATSSKALAANRKSGFHRSYWDWSEMLAKAGDGIYPYTPASNLVAGLSVALKMLLDEEGLDNVYDRHSRLARATRSCVQSWGLEIQCLEKNDQSNVLTAVRLPDGMDADALRSVILNRYDVALGNGLGQIAGKVFRIGHLGDLNETMLMGTLSAIELGLRASQISISGSGVAAALGELEANANDE